MKKNTEVMTRNFVDITTFFPDYQIESNRYIIYKSILTESDIENIKVYWNEYRNQNFLSTFNIGKEYVILHDKSINKTMMSSHEFEIVTNQKFLDNAKGDVLIFGLGLGLIVHPLLQDKSIKSITIVEIDDGLIDLVFPIVIENDPYTKVNVINSDAFSFETDMMFDTIYFDIWSVIDNRAFEEMSTLSHKFQKNLNQDGWMDSWSSEEQFLNNEFK